jgi:hypothetical protein
MRFQLVVATLAIGGALVLTQSQGPRPEAGPVFTFQDGAIDESSGLVDAGSTVLTVNDSGDGPVVYVVDRSTGQTVGRTTYTDDEVVDVEALAAGPDDTLWVGDIGDNPWSRSSVAVYALPMPGPGDRTVESQRYDLVYEGGPRDAEALLVHPVTGRLHVVSKGLFGGQVFEAPRRLSAEKPNVLRPVADVDGLVTDGAFLPDGRFAALRSYSNLTILAADGWRNVQGMRLPDQDQGEGLAVGPEGDSVLLSTEGARTEVLALPLSEAILDRVAAAEPARPDPPTPAEPARPAPSSDKGDVGQVIVVAGGTVILVGGVVLWLRRRQSR